MNGQALWVAAAAGIAFSLAGAPPARADHRDRQQDCWRKIEKEEHKLHRDTRRHGWFSRQAQHRREKIARLRHECGRRDGWGRNRGWRVDEWRDRGYRQDRWDFHADGRGRFGYWDHDPHRCRVFDHHHDRYSHDRFGRFRWSGAFWLRIR
jgi:hypothetical protein